jgi:hypothetical protein
MNPRSLRAIRRVVVSASLVAIVWLPRLAAAQSSSSSPFLTGATALENNIIAWLTPIAIILVITSVHAASAELAFEQLVLLVKQSRAGSELARQDIKSLLYLLVDVVIQFGVENHERFIKEIWYEPQRKHGRKAREAND